MIEHNANCSNDFIPHPIGGSCVRISGQIKNYRKYRENGIFVFTKNEKSTIEAVAVLASFADLGGQAVSLSSSAHTLEEVADYVEFDIDEKKLKGWLWRSPFSNMDNVHVAAEWCGDYYEIYGVCRPADQTIALYPHCSRATIKHIKNAIKWWWIVSMSFCLCMFMGRYFDFHSVSATLDYYAGFYRENNGLIWIFGIFSAVTVPIVSMTIQWMPFVRVAEKVFVALKLPNARNIDLIKSSRGRKTAEDTAEYGSMYFRY